MLFHTAFTFGFGLSKVKPLDILSVSHLICVPAINKILLDKQLSLVHLM